MLLLSDPVDAFWVRTALGFDGKPFQSVTQGAADLDRHPAPRRRRRQDDAGPRGDRDARRRLKQTLGDAVQDVRRSQRLTDSPVCLVAGDEGMDRTLERLLARQGAAGMKASAPILEINAGHALIRQLAESATKGASPELGDAAHLLFDMARVLDGETVPDPTAFTQRLGAVMQKGL